MARPGWLRRAKGHPKSTSTGLRLGFRSGLEEKNGAHLEANGLPVLFEVRKIKYLVPATLRTYTVDFELPNGILVETKGIFDATDRAKHLFIKLQYPGLDIRFVFQRANKPVSPGVKMTCREWAEKHGFKWAEALIPVEWMREPGPGGAAGMTGKGMLDALLSRPPADL